MPHKGSYGKSPSNAGRNMAYSATYKKPGADGYMQMMKKNGYKMMGGGMSQGKNKMGGYY